ncbi:uncharacterized protein AMSG_10322 [Thecamonas trahens ATCC 50062]|uniref:C2 domain-containing protein n=1 Tax=Thecamonas trahens ATCC 50062 TaxID=461836 RepID=A0A0L0DSA1_THETB|nr:hypothetical protein AMSG_10322 [Thecamonas trahens ATCC 50062]KNC54333.1 hypothetical protein AMSG_10322 [Thecamonas trahens ATCC 50062]|eukprot:XP_013753790.1 hypothetical protein AMSG_10322 [Thecamonas trahens ATCC 50062]
MSMSAPNHHHHCAEAALAIATVLGLVPSPLTPTAATPGRVLAALADGTLLVDLAAALPLASPLAPHAAPALADPPPHLALLAAAASTAAAHLRPWLHTLPRPLPRELPDSRPDPAASVDLATAPLVGLAAALIAAAHIVHSPPALRLPPPPTSRSPTSAVVDAVAGLSPTARAALTSVFTAHLGPVLAALPRSTPEPKLPPPPGPGLARAVAMRAAIIDVHVREARGLREPPASAASELRDGAVHASIRLHLVRSTRAGMLVDTLLEPGSSNVVSHVYETATVAASWAPSYDERFEFATTHVDGKAILFHVLHHSHTAGKIFPIGWVVLPLLDAFPHPLPGVRGEWDGWLDILPLAAFDRDDDRDFEADSSPVAPVGKLSLVIGLTLAGEPDCSSAASSSSADSSRTDLPHPATLAFRAGLLRVTILSAAGLPAMDYRGMSDPYCEMHLVTQLPSSVDGNVAPSAITLTHTTRTIASSLEPVWDQTFELELDSPSSFLVFRLWDKDRNTRDLLAFVIEPVVTLTTDVLGNARGRSKQVYQLRIPPSVPKAAAAAAAPTLTVLYDWAPETGMVASASGTLVGAPSNLNLASPTSSPSPQPGRTNDLKFAPDEPASTKSHFVPGTLYVTVVNAVELAARDSSGTSDPLAVVFLLHPDSPPLDASRTAAVSPEIAAATSGIVSFETDVVPRSCNPVWNATFRFAVDVPDSTLLFRLFDEDTMRRQFLGQAQLDLAELTSSAAALVVHSDGEEIKRWLPLGPMDAPASDAPPSPSAFLPSGSVLVKLRYAPDPSAVKALAAATHAGPGKVIVHIHAANHVVPTQIGFPTTKVEAWVTRTAGAGAGTELPKPTDRDAVGTTRTAMPSHAPHFGSHLEFSMPSAEASAASYLHLQLLNTSVSPPAVLGATSLSLRPLMARLRVASEWYALHPPPAAASSPAKVSARSPSRLRPTVPSLQLGLEWAAAAATAARPARAGGPPARTTGAALRPTAFAGSILLDDSMVSGHLVVSVVSSKSLGVSLGFRGNRHVVLAVADGNGRERESHATPSVAKVVNPSWGSTHVFSTLPRYGALVGRVYDTDSLGESLLGTFSIELIKFINAAGTTIDDLVRLVLPAEAQQTAALPDMATGALRLKVVYKTSPAPAAPAVASSLLDGTGESGELVPGSPFPSAVPVLPPIGISPISARSTESGTRGSAPPPTLTPQRSSSLQRITAASRQLAYPDAGAGALSALGHRAQPWLADLRKRVTRFSKTVSELSGAALLGAIGVETLKVAATLSLRSPLVFAHAFGLALGPLQSLLDGLLPEAVSQVHVADLVSAPGSSHVVLRARLDDELAIIVLGLTPFAGLSHAHTKLYAALGALASVADSDVERVVTVYLNQLSHPSLFGAADQYAVTTRLTELPENAAAGGPSDEGNNGPLPLVDAHFVCLDRYERTPGASRAMGKDLARLLYFILHSDEHGRVESWTSLLLSPDVLVLVKALSLLAMEPAFVHAVAMDELVVVGSIQTGEQLIALMSER